MSAAAPRPAPATATPAGSSQGAGRRSVSWPNSGWSTDDDTVWARTNPAAAAYDRRRSRMKKGSMAGTAPWLRSTLKWPADSRPSVSRSMTRSGSRRRAVLIALSLSGHQVEQAVGDVDDAARPAACQVRGHPRGGQRPPQRLGLGHSRGDTQPRPDAAVHLDDQGHLLRHERRLVVGRPRLAVHRVGLAQALP